MTLQQLRYVTMVAETGNRGCQQALYFAAKSDECNS